MPVTTRAAAAAEEGNGTPRPVPKKKTRKEDVEELNERIEELESCCRGRTTRITKLKSMNKGLSDEVREKNAEIRELKEKLENESTYIAREADLKDREARLEAEQKQLSEKKYRVEAEEARLKKEKVRIEKAASRQDSELAAEKKKVGADLEIAGKEIEMLRAALKGTGRDRTVFECNICVREFFHQNDRIPRILRCGHTFCEHCIRKQANGNWLMLCMTCREPSHLPTGVSGLTKNYQVIP